MKLGVFTFVCMIVAMTGCTGRRLAVTPSDEVRLHAWAEDAVAAVLVDWSESRVKGPRLYYLEVYGKEPSPRLIEDMAREGVTIRKVSELSVEHPVLRSRDSRWVRIERIRREWHDRVVIDVIYFAGQVRYRLRRDGASWRVEDFEVIHYASAEPAGEPRLARGYDPRGALSGGGSECPECGAACRES